ncbi:hypothetical protein GGD81_000583 [Rhodobium orientis]|uniref:Sulfotransferase family protein n=1 Tax=Rhodobium orientis TaxID=34017 RepID=A0A327JJH5_9HYPH|nr:sulfotransferase family 2 domain-containing protein [Rhodobium orientis]MBB4301566.1 hypothetical protein [Rhodobium orientis]MBK5952262.1 hypothetical protein [Rhodobium orientis]RAI24952.1 hypothetical protein CH339_20455 [Rhodobium orientis]
MILSHEHRFIYIKTYKTASTSIEAALSEVCGPDDVITPASKALMKVRKDERAQNWRLDHPLVPKRPLVKRLLGRPERAYHPSVGFYEHMPAWRVRAYVGEAIWNSYYKFSFERNPWDRQVSWYYYKTKSREARPSFEDFLRNPKRSYVENFDLYSIDDTIALDFVGRYEILAEDFAAVLDAIGLSGRVSLPVSNVSGAREDDYRSYYTEHTRTMVGGWYRREIEAFGYLF